MYIFYTVRWSPIFFGANRTVFWPSGFCQLGLGDFRNSLIFILGVYVTIWWSTYSLAHVRNVHRVESVVKGTSKIGLNLETSKTDPEFRAKFDFDGFGTVGRSPTRHLDRFWLGLKYGITTDHS